MGEVWLILITCAPQDLRAHLPEQRLSCGFWPACAGTQLLLPKPCWKELRRNFSACGRSDESVNNAIEREMRLPPRQRMLLQQGGLRVGPDGPMVFANSSGRERLCLSTWRGSLQPAAGAVFQRCPTTLKKKTAHASVTGAFQWTAVGMPRLAPESSAIDARRIRLSPIGAPHLCLAAAPVS